MPRVIYSTPIPAKISFGVDQWCWGLQRVNILY